MRQQDALRLDTGLYRLHWKSGGFSLAAVGQLRDGARWFAPSDWQNGLTSTRWSLVERAEAVPVVEIREATRA